MPRLLLFAVFLLLLSNLPGTAQTNRRPVDNWCVQKATDQDNNLVFITANLGYKNYTFKTEFPWCLAVNMRVINKYANGHPTSEEAPFLNDTEDIITAELEKDGLIHFVGRTSVNGSRELYYFLANPEKANAALLRLTKQAQPRAWEFRMEKDEQWQRVQLFFRENPDCL